MPSAPIQAAKNAFERQVVLVIESPGVKPINEDVAPDSSLAVQLIDGAFVDFREALSKRHESPGAALSLSRRGLRCLLRCREILPTEVRAPVLASGLALLANVLRLNGDLAAAAKCWADVQQKLVDSEAGPPLLGLLAELRGSFFRATRHFNRATACYAEASEEYAGMPQGQGRVELLLSFLYETQGNRGLALNHLDRALDLLEPGRDAFLTLALLHNRVSYMSDLGHHTQAVYLFDQIEPLYDALGQDLLLVRGLWLKGRLALACGGAEEAIPALRSVKDAFIARTIPYDAALASLDLALACSRAGRYEEVQRLAEEMIPVFRSYGIEREARRALLQWVDAVRRRRADVATVRQIQERLAEIARQPLDLANLPRRR